MWLVTTPVDHIGLTDLFADTNVITLATAPIGLGCQPARTPLSGNGEIKGSTPFLRAGSHYQLAFPEYLDSPNSSCSVVNRKTKQNEKLCLSLVRKPEWK